MGTDITGRSDDEVTLLGGTQCWENLERQPRVGSESKQRESVRAPLRARDLEHPLCQEDSSECMTRQGVTGCPLTHTAHSPCSILKTQERPFLLQHPQRPLQRKLNTVPTVKEFCYCRTYTEGLI